MDTQLKETHKDIYKETTEDILKGNSNKGQSISPPPHQPSMISFMYLKPLLVVLLIH